MNQALRGVKEYLHYLILLRFTISEFFTAKMTYWMACYQTKKIDQQSDVNEKWLTCIKSRDRIILAYKFFQIAWILACESAEIYHIFKFDGGQPFPDQEHQNKHHYNPDGNHNNDHFFALVESVLGCKEIYVIDCYYAIVFRIVATLLIAAAMLYYVLAQRLIKSYGF